MLHRVSIYSTHFVFEVLVGASLNLTFAVYRNLVALKI